MDKCIMVKLSMITTNITKQTMFKLTIVIEHD
jgi:hypothetical protein